MEIDDRPLKLLMLSSSYPRHSTDSASVFLRHLAEHLYERNLTVHILAPADEGANTSFENGIIVHRFRYFFRPWQNLAYGSGIMANLQQKPWLLLQVPPFFFSMLYSTIRLIRKERPDLIHAHWVIPQGLIAVIVKFFYNIPVVTTVHGGDAFALKGNLLAKLKRFILAKSEAWTSNTKATSASILGDLPIGKLCIIPMGVDVNYFRSGKRDKLRLGVNATYVVLFVGRLVEKKGVDDLIEAFAILPANLRAVTELWIVGDGERKMSLQAKAAGLGIQDKIRFWGRVANDQLPDYYAAADLFVGASVVASNGDTEGQGVVFLEAFAAGTAVIATDVGGISEVVENAKTGILVSPRNPYELSAAVERLLDNSSLRRNLAENAFNKVSKTYTWEKIAQEFELLYRLILRATLYRSPT